MKILSTSLPYYFLPFVLLLIVVNARGQDTTATTVKTQQKNWTVGGYLKDLQSIQFTDVNKKWALDNLVHNRIDLHWYPSTKWKIHIGMRNRLLYGESTSVYGDSIPGLEDNGFFDLSKTIASGESYLLHTIIDRASVDYTSGKWEVTMGRQRINWGLNLVWNPNDIFNAYSYFDFDYEERPGTDAVRVQYYLNSTSSAEVAYRPGKVPDEMVAAGMYRFTKGSYDMQVLAGRMRTDYVLAGGWSGVLAKAGFNGEITAFIPCNDLRISQTVVSASLGINYTFSNSLYLHGAYLFNSSGILKSDSISDNILSGIVSAKSLSPARHSVFAEAAYQFSPLIRGDLAAIANPADGSFFIGPSFNFSLTNTIELLLAGQLFFGDANSLYGSYGRIIFLRLKWSF
jgi:hypothetical protein